MYDEIDDETWRKYTKPKAVRKRYVGMCVTASQFAYLGRSGDVYAHIFVQSWFRRYEVSIVSVFSGVVALPQGNWEQIPGTAWQRYVVAEHE